MPFSFLMPLLTYPDPTPMDGLPRVLDLAATLTGTITALVHEVDIPPISNVLAEMVIDVASMIAAAELRSRTNGEELIAALQHRAHRLSLALAIETARSRPELIGGLFAHAARTHDFTLLLPAQHGEEHSEMVQSILFGSGGPAIVFPVQEAPAHLNVVAVAWDGSRAAARALRDALPVLARAKRTIMLTAQDDKAIDLKLLEGARRFLEGHSIETAHQEIVGNTASIGDSLQAAALTADAGLLVMGAYGHSRIREFILGGATRAILRSRKLPILMSH